MAETKRKSITGLFPLPVTEHVPSAMFLAQFGGSGTIGDKEFSIVSTCGFGGVGLIINYGDRQFVIDGTEVIKELSKRDQAGTLVIEEDKDVVRKRGRKPGS